MQLIVELFLFCWIALIVEQGRIFNIILLLFSLIEKLFIVIFVYFYGFLLILAIGNFFLCCVPTPIWWMLFLSIDGIEILILLEIGVINFLMLQRWIYGYIMRIMLGIIIQHLILVKSHQSLIIVFRLLLQLHVNNLFILSSGTAILMSNKL